MNDLDILSKNETASKHLHDEAAADGAREKIKPDLNGSASDANGLPFLLRAALSSSTLFRYDSNMEPKHENATTISPDRELQETTSTKKCIISAKEARRLVLLDMERAEERRRQYVEELARLQTEFFKLGD